jgi:hypothetical protein
MFGNRTLRTMPSPVMKAEVSERYLALGASVLAGDKFVEGTLAQRVDHLPPMD